MTVNDLSIYENYAQNWWNPSALQFRSLINITPFRLKLITDWIGPVKDLNIIDLGCGGGLISLPLLAQGAKVTGIDLSPASIQAIKERSQGQGTFFSSDLTNVNLAAASADVVILADVLDHIPNYPLVIEKAAKALNRAENFLLRQLIAPYARNYWPYG